MGSVLPLRAPSPPGQAITNVSAQMGSSFGLDMTTLGPEYNASGLYNSERANELKFRDSFFTATNHDYKLFDMNGRMLRPGKLSNQPLLSGAVPQTYIPLSQRRPSNPVRVGRKIVTAFTSLVFGYGRFPQFRSEDPDTQDWSTAIAEKMAIEIAFIRARNIGGRQGTTGVSWALVDGDLRLQVHHGQYCHVIEWEDEDLQIAAHVTELIQRKQSATKTGKEQWQWYRRDWTKTADIVFKPIPVSKKTPDFWEVDQEASCTHNSGECHFHWIQNLPDDDVVGSCDGSPDYAVAYEQMGELDMLNSVNGTGAIKNLDPTLVLQMDEEEIGKAVVRKGSDNAIVAGKGGDAKYLELSGQSIAAGTQLVNNNKNQILELCECVVPDPNVIAASGTSSVALKMIYAPMLEKCGILRHQYGRAIVRILEQVTKYARERLPDLNAETDEQRYAHIPKMDPETNEPVIDEAGEVVYEAAEFTINLPPRVVTTPVKDEAGQPTGEVTTQEFARTPGRGRIWLEWGPYFPPTADDYSKTASAYSTAAGGKSVMSQQTAVELHANDHDRDGQEEWRRVQKEMSDDADRQAKANSGMFPPIGGGTVEEQT